MSTILFRGNQTKPWMACFIIVSWLTLNCCALSRAATATENQETPQNAEMEFTGTGSEKTRVFTVEGGWKIQWKTESPRFKLSAHGSAHRPYIGPTNERDAVLQWFETIQPIVLANTTDTHGTAVHHLGGTYYFTIIATGPWSISLKTFKDTKDYLDVPYTGAP